MLFQAICRVNRVDTEDKDYGYIIDYKDFKCYLDTTVHYRLEGDYCAFINGIKNDFKYDELMGRVKPQYKDSFGRIINVTKIN